MALFRWFERVLGLFLRFFGGFKFWFLLQSFRLLIHHFSRFRNGLWKELNHCQTDFIQRCFFSGRLQFLQDAVFNCWMTSKTQVCMFQAEVVSGRFGECNGRKASFDNAPQVHQEIRMVFTHLLLRQFSISMLLNPFSLWNQQ